MKELEKSDKAYIHSEAFNLMKYETDDGLESEIIWNSRDGVTPFIISNRDKTKMMTHVRWSEDVCVPNHVPKPGDRIFVDVTPEMMRDGARKQIEKFWDHPTYPMKKSFSTKEEAMETLSKFNPGEPAVITVNDGKANQGPGSDI